MRSKHPATVEQIPCRARPRPAQPRAEAKGSILLRMDSAAWGRATRLDLERQGYRITSVKSLSTELISRHAPDAILFFHHAEESPEALTHLPADMPVIVANVGGAPSAHVAALAEARGYRVLQSRCGPCLHQVMRALAS